jgi:urocanate hydratase
VVTDQTSAHDPLNGYVPGRMTLEEALKLRSENPEQYVELSMESMARHVQAMLDFKNKGSIVFDYGNNIRQQAFNHGLKNALISPDSFRRISDPSSVKEKVRSGGLRFQEIQRIFIVPTR